MDHDGNFKNLIIDYPRQALRFFASDEAAPIDGDTEITLLRQEQLKARLSDRYRELDVPLMVKWPDGTREALLFVLEKETEPRRFSVHRLAHYCLDLAELMETDRVVPVVIFLYDGNYTTHLVLGGDRHKYLNFRYLDFALARQPWEEYRDSDNLVARLNLPNMRYRAEQRAEVFVQALRGLRALELDSDKRRKYFEFIDIYSDLDDNEREGIKDIFSEEEQRMGGFVEQFRKEGLEQGIQQGMERGMEQGMQQGVAQGLTQGMQRGEAAVLMRQMERKFGPLTSEIRQRVEKADAETLLEWSDRILTATTPEEVWH